MKRFLTLLMIAFIVYSCESEHSNLKSDLLTANLKGNVRKIERTVSDTKNKCACAIKDECNKSKFTYDIKGNLIKSFTIDEDDRVNDSTVYVYNKHGVCSEINRYNGTGFTGKDVPLMEKGKLAGYKTYNDKGVVETTSGYIYSGDEITEEKTINANGEIISSIQKEFLNDQLVSQTEKDAKGNVLTVTHFKRNANNDVIEYMVSVSRENKEFKFTYEYEYDSTGNWTKQTRFYNGEIENIVIRNIEYYKS